MFQLSSWNPYSEDLLYSSHVPRKQTVKTFAPNKKQTIHNALKRPEDPEATPASST